MGEREVGREREGTGTGTLLYHTPGVCVQEGGGWGGAVNGLTVAVTFHLEKVCPRCTLVGGSNKVKDKVSKNKAKTQQNNNKKQHTHTHPHTRVRTHTRTHTHIERMCVCVCVCVHVFVSVFVSVFVCAFVCFFWGEGGAGIDRD